MQMLCFLKICLDMLASESKYFEVECSIVFISYQLTTNEIKFFHCNKKYFSNFLSRSSGGRSGGRLPDRDAPPGSGGGTGPDRDRENFSRWRERQYFGPRKWLESALTYSSYEKDSGN